jgi:uncharacterized protein YjbI with pentapeptide repeats
MKLPARFDYQELLQIINKHQKYINGELGGEKAILRGVNLYSASLIAVNLQGADLSGANLIGADLEDFCLDGATYNHETRWPIGFDPDSKGAVSL